MVSSQWHDTFQGARYKNRHSCCRSGPQHRELFEGEYDRIQLRSIWRICRLGAVSMENFLKGSATEFNFKQYGRLEYEGRNKETIRELKST
jgi:hypothetical protein